MIYFHFFLFFLYPVENKNESEIQWDINYSDLFKCKVDNQNQVNVYFLGSLDSSKNYIDYEEK